MLQGHTVKASAKNDAGIVDEAVNTATGLRMHTGRQGQYLVKLRQVHLKRPGITPRRTDAVCHTLRTVAIAIHDHHRRSLPCELLCHQFANAVCRTGNQEYLVIEHATSPKPFSLPDGAPGPFLQNGGSSRKPAELRGQFQAKKRGSSTAAPFSIHQMEREISSFMISLVPP